MARWWGRIWPLAFGLSLLPLWVAPLRAAEIAPPVLSLPQGGVVLLLFPPSSSVKEVVLGATRSRVHLWRHQSSRASGAREDSYQAVLVGVDFSTPPERLPLTLSGPDGHQTLSLAVTSRPFQVSRLSVARSFVTPPASFLRRLARERKVILAALAAPDRPFLFHRAFVAPLSGKITHDFGAYRYLNGREMARHSGEDIDAPMGTPVHAANDGIVRLAGSFYYDGNMVIIDHGGGLLTEYLHMSDMAVHAGDRVVRGQVIGRVGHTGRVTGPVLHYGAVLRGAHVNPMMLTALLSQAVHLQGKGP
ncbi:MAG: M23 family metallopeptidase [Leptospirillia bacterium]